MTVSRIGANTADNYTGLDDTQLVQGSPTANFASSVELEVTRYLSGDQRTTLIRPTGLNSIPDAAVVTAVSLFLYQFDGAVAAASYLIEGRRLLRDVVPTEATWNAYRSGAGNSWTDGGALGDASDRLAAASLISGVLDLTAGYKELVGNAAAIADVQAMIAGTLPIYGWVIQRVDAGALGAGDYAFRKFRSAEAANGVRPYLSVTYTVPTSGITNVDGDNTVRSDQTVVAINGAAFGAAQGTGTVILRYSSRSVSLPVRSWSDNLIVVDMALGNIPFGTGPFVRVVTNGGTTYDKTITHLPPIGHAYTWLTSIAATAAERLEALPSLPVNSMVWYCGPSGGPVPSGLTVNPDGRSQWADGTTEAPWYARLWDVTDETYQAAFALQYYTNLPPDPDPGSGGSPVVVAAGRPLRAAGARLNWRR